MQIYKESLNRWVPAMLTNVAVVHLMGSCPSTSICRESSTESRLSSEPPSHGMETRPPPCMDFIASARCFLGRRTWR